MGTSGRIAARVADKWLRRAIHLFVLVFCGMCLTACDYELPLFLQAERQESGLVGEWVRSLENGTHERLVILPADRGEYVVCYPCGSSNALLGIVRLGRIGDWPMAQVRWLGNLAGKEISPERPYQYARYRLTTEALEIKLLNPEVVKATARSREEFEEALHRHEADERLFREPMIFKRSHHSQTAETVQNPPASPVQD